VLHVNAAIEPPPVNEYTTYFVPTVNAVESMAVLAGFQPVSTSVANNGRRATVLAQAMPPSKIEGRTPLMADAHERLARPGPAIMSELDYVSLEAGTDGTPSTVQYGGHRGRRDLDIRNFESPTPLQPTPQRLAALDAADADQQ